MNKYKAVNVPALFKFCKIIYGKVAFKHHYDKTDVMQHLQISIPKPCHQDWNRMTPEERGRFCSVCSKTVHDFSEKTNDEIREFITAHRNENLCGRFRKDQIEQPLRIELPLPVYRSQLSFLNTFIVALLFCFGTALFSCNIPPNPLTVGEVNIQDSKAPEKNISDLNDSAALANKVFYENCVVGNFIIPDKHILEEEKHLTGTVAVESLVADGIDSIADLPPVDITASTAWSISGGIVAEWIDDSIAEETNSAVTAVAQEKNSARNETGAVSEEDLFVSVYPNPSDGQLNIEFKTAESQYVQMDLFDAVGRTVWNIIPPGFLQPELQTLKVDVSDQPPGIYFLRISAGDTVKTERVVIAHR